MKYSFISLRIILTHHPVVPHSDHHIAQQEAQKHGADPLAQDLPLALPSPPLPVHPPYISSCSDKVVYERETPQGHETGRDGREDPCASFGLVGGEVGWEQVVGDEVEGEREEEEGREEESEGNDAERQRGGRHGLREGDERRKKRGVCGGPAGPGLRGREVGLRGSG